VGRWRRPSRPSYCMLIADGYADTNVQYIERRPGPCSLLFDLVLLPKNVNQTKCAQRTSARDAKKQMAVPSPWLQISSRRTNEPLSLSGMSRSSGPNINHTNFTSQRMFDRPSRCTTTVSRSQPRHDARRHFRHTLPLHTVAQVLNPGARALVKTLACALVGTWTEGLSLASRGERAGNSLSHTESNRGSHYKRREITANPV
jgi:hypothetical protein